MALSGNDKSEARAALAMALELNEPETMIEGLRRLCAKRLEEAGLSDQERDRWQAALHALASAGEELASANAPKERAPGAPTPQAAPGSDC